MRLLRERPNCGLGFRFLVNLVYSAALIGAAVVPVASGVTAGVSDVWLHAGAYGVQAGLVLWLLEARPKTPSRLRIANKAHAADPEVLEVEELRLRPSGPASRTSSRFSLRVGFTAGPPAPMVSPMVAAAASVVAAGLMGGMTELLQRLVEGRTAQAHDLAADVGGAAVVAGSWLAVRLVRNRRAAGGTGER